MEHGAPLIGSLLSGIPLFPTAKIALNLGLLINQVNKEYASYCILAFPDDKD